MNKEAGYWNFWTSSNYASTKLPQDFVKEVLLFFVNHDFVLHKDTFTMVVFHEDEAILSNREVDIAQFLNNSIELADIGVNDSVYCVFHINTRVNVNQFIVNTDALRVDFRFNKEQYDIQITCTDCLLPIRKLKNYLEIGNWGIYRLHKFRLRKFLTDLNNQPLWEDDYSQPVIIDRSEYGCWLTGTDMFLSHSRVRGVLEDLENGDPEFISEEYEMDYPYHYYGINESEN